MKYDTFGSPDCFYFSYIFRPTSNHAKNSAQSVTGSKPGEIFDHITNLLEDFENEDTAVEKSNINSEKSTEDAFNMVIKVKFRNLNSIIFLKVASEEINH